MNLAEINAAAMKVVSLLDDYAGEDLRRAGYTVTGGH